MPILNLIAAILWGFNCGISVDRHHHYVKQTPAARQNLKKSQKYSIIYIEVKGKEKQGYILFRKKMFDELLTFEKFFRIINT